MWNKSYFMYSTTVYIFTCKLCHVVKPGFGSFIFNVSVNQKRDMGKPLKEGLGHFDLWLSNKILPTVDFWHKLDLRPT